MKLQPPILPGHSTTNHTGMISLSIAKQKKVMALLLRINYMTTSPLANYLTLLAPLRKTSIMTMHLYIRYGMHSAYLQTETSNLKQYENESILKHTGKLKMENPTWIDNNGLLDNVKGKHQVS